MANKEHLAILEQGVEAWNDWRDEDPTTQPELGSAELGGVDLQGAHLSGADLVEATLSKAVLIGADLQGARLSQANLIEANLSKAVLIGADLSESLLSGVQLFNAVLNEATLNKAVLIRAVLVLANLSKANLSKANLSQAYLFGATLGGADLTGADLTGADLSRANLTGANLSGADLSEADLSYANLREADLRGANVKGARIGETTFYNVDLSTVNGLENVKHHSTSTIDIYTLYESRGKIPEGFLRGCGVPDGMMAFIASLPGQPETYRTWLRLNLDKCFDESELRNLCLDMAIDYGELNGQHKPGKAQALVAYCERRQIIPAFVAKCKELRPKVSWEGEHE